MTDTPAEARSVTELRACTGPIAYLHFWGHTPPDSGEVTAACLSQWWPAVLTVGGVSYATAEHYMMAGKARLFGDHAMAERIAAAAEPREAKKLGRQVRGFDQQVW